MSKRRFRARSIGNLAGMREKTMNSLAGMMRDYQQSAFFLPPVEIDYAEMPESVRSELNEAGIDLKTCQLVVAEMLPGSLMLGLRFDEDHVVHFLQTESASPLYTCLLLARVLTGQITLGELCVYDWVPMQIPDKVFKKAHEDFFTEQEENKDDEK